MSTQFHRPPSLYGAKLDAYLVKGWFRSGQYIYTVATLNIDGALYFPIRIRLPLTGYEFRKSLRKVWNKNKCFKTVIGKAFITPEKEALYQKFLVRFDTYISPTLKDSLQEGGETTIYNTFEAAIYEGDKLIAVSFFDLGKNTMASIMGVFDPAYSKYGLGFYTMLVEIAYGKEKGYTYYYPGYVIPGYPKFDYKLRIGQVESYDQFNDFWEPMDIEGHLAGL